MDLTVRISRTSTQDYATPVATLAQNQIRRSRAISTDNEEEPLLLTLYW